MRVWHDMYLTGAQQVISVSYKNRGGIFLVRGYCMVEASPYER